MRSTKLLVFMVVLQALVLVGQWTGGPQYVSTAQAQIPDAGSQRIQILDELKTLNGKMDKLIAILDSGNLQVRVATPDENKGRAPAK